MTDKGRQQSGLMTSWMTDGGRTGMAKARAGHGEAVFGEVMSEHVT